MAVFTLALRIDVPIGGSRKAVAELQELVGIPLLDDEVRAPNARSKL